MGWFDEQIRERKRRDEASFAEAMDEISSIITRKPAASEPREEDGTEKDFCDSLREILRFFRIQPPELPDGLQTREDRLDAFCRPCGLMHRTVQLEKGWYRDCVGPLLGTKKDGTPVALIPGRLSGYFYTDRAAGKRVRLNAKTAAELSGTALCFYKPLPLRKLGVRDLLKYAAGSVPVSAYAAMLGLLLLTTLVGMLSPRITHAVYSQVIPSENMRLFWAVILFSVFVTLGAFLIGIAKTLMDSRINTQMNLSVQAAAIARVMSLPPDFFKRFSAGELNTKLQYFQSLCSTLYSNFLAVGLTSLFSLIYLTQVFRYAPSLVVPSLCVTVLTLGFSVLGTVLRMRYSRRAMEAAGKKNGMTYSLLTGIQKIRLAGAETRAFSRWTRLYAEEVRSTYGIPTALLLCGIAGHAVSLLGTVLMYYLAVRSGISTADYFAFTAAYGVVSGAFTSLVSIGLQAAAIRPALDQVRPILEAVPENSAEKQVVTRLSGGIELSHVSFRYGDDQPWVLSDLSLKIRPGQYVAIVGKSGCGKSTLLRLLLGFETARSGAVYYDGKDIQRLDLRSLRRKIGVVTQNGKLFCGDIFSNITISAPWLSLQEAWEAAELAHIADDIRAMPMGMHTYITEGSGGISGGQRQRLMIARAIAPKPRILMFDEATSALDNITQKKVSEALDGLKCTRIVIAHRLSTIRHCDRILVLDKGRIVEDGTYGELLERKGFFAELVERQRLDTAAAK